MIFHFTGTGNSRWVAEVPRKALEEPLTSIVEVLTEGKGEHAYPLGEREEVIFMFLVHSWGSTVLVTHFTPWPRLEGHGGQAVYFVCTCGDNCGHMDRIIQKTLQKRGIILMNDFSVQMSNSYVLMPGFDVDSKEVETDRLRKTSKCIQGVTGSIRRKENLPLCYAGGVPFLKSYLVYPLFMSFAIGDSRFYATETYVSCGICAKTCPTGMISLSDDRKPEWADTCVQCVACIHRYPVHAVEYGKISLKKGCYHHPKFK